MAPPDLNFWDSDPTLLLGILHGGTLAAPPYVPPTLTGTEVYSVLAASAVNAL